MDIDRIRQLYAALDRLDAHAFAGFFAPEGRLVVGNGAPARGPRAIEHAASALFGMLEGLSHGLLGAWEHHGLWTVETEASFQVRGAGTPVVLRTAEVIRCDDDLIVDLRRYLDLGPVYATAHRSRGGSRTVQGLPVHRADHDRGGFTWEQDGEVMAALSYTREGHLMIIDNVEVGSTLRHHGVGHALVESAARWARERHLKVQPLCPFARAMFDARPDLRDVRA